MKRISPHVRTSWSVASAAAATMTGAYLMSAVGDTSVSGCQPERKPTEEIRKHKIHKRQSENIQRRALIRCHNGGSEQLHEDYEILAPLGRGAFGSVRTARHKLTGLIRAVKTVEFGPEALKEQGNFNRMDEVRALTELDHPNLVRLFEYYKEADVLYLVQEYCRGGTLENRINEKRREGLAKSEVSVILRQMVRGVLYCHAHGLVHRDLKPNNFVFDSTESETAALKVIDFGLSVGVPTEQTENKYVMAAGTLEHSAPETLPVRDTKSGEWIRIARYDTAADMWSIGVIFYLMLTGEQLINMDKLTSETAEFGRMMRALVCERELVDDVAEKVRSVRFMTSRLAVAKRKCEKNPEAYDLLEKLLQMDPAKRITATQALKHRFIADSYLHVQPRGHGVFDPNSISKMRRFTMVPAMCRIAVLVEAHLLGPRDDVSILDDTLSFRAADLRDRGELSTSDIAEALSAQGLEVPEDLEELCESADIHQNGFLNFIEFIAATMEPRIFRERHLCQAAFNVLDVDSDGYITRSDLEHILTESPQRKDMATEILESANPDEEGRVNFTRFYSLMGGGDGGGDSQSPREVHKLIPYMTAK